MSRMAELRNEFSWSRSRGASFESCARRYWFTYYGSWGGWKESAPPRVRQAYILKQLQTRWMWVGDAVHRTVARVLVSARAGEAMAESVAVEEGLKGMREEYRASKQGKYRERPKKECGLYEHEYGVELTDAEWGEVADHFRACVGAYYTSPYAERLPKLPRGSWLPVEELDAFDFEGVKVYVRPDFAYRTGPDTVEIIDWKTGRKSEEADPIQLACYALYALGKGWAAGPEDVTTTEYNLAQGKARESVVTPPRLEAVRGAMRSSIAAMKQLLDDPAKNVATEGAFPVAEDAGECRRCNYLKICPESPVNVRRA